MVNYGSFDRHGHQLVYLVLEQSALHAERNRARARLRANTTGRKKLGEQFLLKRITGNPVFAADRRNQ